MKTPAKIHVLCSTRPRPRGARPLRWSWLPWLDALIGAAWIATAAGSVHTLVTTALTPACSAWVFLLVPLLVVAVSVVHELGHATALLGLGLGFPRMGLAFQADLGVYPFTALTELRGRAAGDKLRVLVAGYRVELVLGALFAAAAHAAGLDTRLGATVAASQAALAFLLVVGMNPANPRTDLGQLGILLRRAPATRRAAAWIAPAWYLASLATLAWLVLVFACMSLGGGS